MVRSRSWLLHEDAASIVAEYAARGFSQEATAATIAEVYGDTVSRSAIGGFAARHGIEFHASTQGRRWSAARLTRHRAAMRRSWQMRRGVAMHRGTHAAD